MCADLVSHPKTECGENVWISEDLIPAKRVYKRVGQFFSPTTSFAFSPSLCVVCRGRCSVTTRESIYRPQIRVLEWDTARVDMSAGKSALALQSRNAGWAGAWSDRASGKTGCGFILPEMRKAYDSPVFFLLSL